MTKEEIYRIAMEQSAHDIGCKPEDFLKTSPVVVDFKLGEQARVYFKEPIACNFVSYGNNVVAAVKPEIRGIVEEYVTRYEFYHLFETPSCLWLNERLIESRNKICYMAQYFLPDLDRILRIDSRYDLKILYPSDFSDLYTGQWSNALCADRREYDKIAIGAYDSGRLIGLAGCSADCEKMWQIGVDVLPEYRNRGVAAALTSNLAIEALACGKIPFYCCAWSNIPSSKNASRSGFLPAWVEMTVKPSSFVDSINEKNK